MSSAFLSTKNAISAALEQTPALADGRIYAEPDRPMQAGYSSFIVLKQAPAEGAESVTGARDWVTRYAIECYVRAPAGADPSAAVDPLLSDADARLGALDAASIGAYSVPPDRHIDWSSDRLDATYACAVITFTVLHRTPTANLQPW